MQITEGEEVLEFLRRMQDGMRAKAPGSFAEWSQEQDSISKTNSRGVSLTSGGYNPGVGMMGPLFTNSRAPTGPSSRPSGNPAIGYRGTSQQFGVPSGVPDGISGSQYADQRRTQPPPWINDVDMASVWYSPMQPVWPFGPPNVNVPREWNYPVGYNLNYVPQRMELYEMLRGMRQSWGVLATIEATRMDQLLRIPWTIQRRDKPRQSSVGVDAMRKLFRHPDGILTFGQWIRKLLFDLFDLDAPAIFMSRDSNGALKRVECQNGATIFPLIDDAGRRPDSDFEIERGGGITYWRRQPAFQQIIYGLPMVNMSEDELMYPMMRPRPELPVFGYSPIEQITVEATEAIRKTFYQLDFWRSGSMPELIVTVPDAWNPRQIAMFQAHFDALLAGNLRQKSQVRFLPGGMKPFDVKNASGESFWSQRDETLIRLACYAFSVSPAPFIRMLNRATAQNAQQTAQEEGLYPLMSWLKDDVMDAIIQEKFGYDDVEFVFQPRPEPDQEKAAKIHDMKIKNGEMSRDEARAEDGLEPLPDGIGAIFTIQTGNAIIPVEAAAAGEAMPMMGTAQTGENSPSRGAKPESQARVQNRPQRGPARPNTDSPAPPTPVHKVTEGELQTANDDATGDLDVQPHLVLHDGNYKKGHVWINGLNISIENAKGSLRGEKDQNGKKWQVKMPAAYGYIRGTIDADGDQTDCYIGNCATADRVWVVDQNKVSKKGKIKGFDEHKVMLCYESLETALVDYLKSHFDGHGHERIDKIVEFTWPEFKSWIRNGDLKAPAADQDVGRVVLKQKDLKKIGDTISSSTNLLSYSQLPAKPQKKKRKPRLLRRGPRFLELTAKTSTL